jgi:hypothetical protein
MLKHGFGCALNPCMEVAYKNVTDKVIVGLQFNAEFTNAVGEVGPAHTNFIDKVNVKPGAKAKNTWGLYVYSHYFTNVRTDVHVKIHKVLFKDGTTWTENPD